MGKNKFDKLIEKAEQGSKEDFLRFVTGIYGANEHAFDHIWRVPVIAPWDGDSLVTTSLSTKTEEELLDMVDEFIADELGDEDGCFISLSKMESEFTEEELKEWKKKIESGELKLDTDAIIVYNKSKLQKEYKELYEKNSMKNYIKTPEEIDNFFSNYVKGVITHERCHLNVNYLIAEEDKYIDEGVEKREISFSEVNGASLTNIEQSNIISSSDDTAIINKYNDERNEVLVDTLSQMMNNYKEGDSVEDCLYRIIEERNGKSQYDQINDIEVLTMYTLFPEDLTKWAVFGAYDDIRENRLQKMIINVCGTDDLLSNEELKKRVQEYVMSLEKDALSEKQIKMLEMLGYPLIKKLDKSEIGSSNVTISEIDSVNDTISDIESEKNKTRELDLKLKKIMEDLHKNGILNDKNYK